MNKQQIQGELKDLRRRYETCSPKSMKSIEYQIKKLEDKLKEVVK